MPQYLSSEELAVYGESRQQDLYGALIFLLVVNNVVVLSRCYVSYRKFWKPRGRFLAEDAMAILSAICADIVIGNLLAATHYGLGLHSWRVIAEDPHMPAGISNAFKHIWVVMIMTGPTFTFIKLTLLFFYRRMFLVNQKWLRIAWWINAVYILLWFFGASGFYIFQCWPLGWYYLQYYQKYQQPVPGGITGQCNATSVFHVALPLIFGLISDISILLLPVAAIYHLRISRGKKFGLACLFGIGLVACALELARILDLLLDTDDKTDPSYGVAMFLILTAAEEVTAVVCICLPFVAPFVWKAVKRRGMFASDTDRGGPVSPQYPKLSPRRGFYKLNAWPTNEVGSASADEAMRNGKIVVRTDIRVAVEDRLA